VTEDEIVLRVEEVLRTLPEVAFTRAPRRPIFILGDLGSITPRFHERSHQTDLLVETYPNDGLAQKVIVFDVLSYMQTANAVAAAVTWLEDQQARRSP
jgi:hypothetical protein